MRAKVVYRLYSYDEIIDLTNYGYDEDKSWDDLTLGEQNEIKDSLRIEKIVDIQIRGIDE